MIVAEKAYDLPTRTNMVSHLLFHQLFPSPTTSQFVFPVADQRLPFTSVWILRGSCGGNRMTPLAGVSERVLPQRGHSTKVTELSVHRLGSMGISIRENVQLGDVLVCACSFTVSVMFCCSFSGTVCRSGSFPFASVGFVPSRPSMKASDPSPSMIQSVSRRNTSSSAARLSVSPLTSVSPAPYDHSRAVVTSFVK